MKAKNCCKTMEMELTGWKAIIYDITRKMDGLSGTEKAKVLPHIEDLHILISEMDERIEHIRNTCTPETGMDDIQTERKAFNSSLTSLRITAEEAMRSLGAGDFGG
jgi:hypothetical protein